MRTHTECLIPSCKDKGTGFSSSLYLPTHRERERERVCVSRNWFTHTLRERQTEVGAADALLLSSACCFSPSVVSNWRSERSVLLRTGAREISLQPAAGCIWSWTPVRKLCWRCYRTLWIMHSSHRGRSTTCEWIGVLSEIVADADCSGVYGFDWFLWCMACTVRSRSLEFRDSDF